MGNFIKAIDAIRPLINQSKTIIQLAEALESLAISENHKEELQKEISQKQSEIAGLEKRAQSISAECGTAKSEANQLCTLIVSKARADAKEIISNANKTADGCLQSALSKVEDLKLEAEDLGNDVASLSVQVDKLEIERDTLAKQIADIKAAIKNL